MQILEYTRRNSASLIESYPLRPSSSRNFPAFALVDPNKSPENTDHCLFKDRLHDFALGSR